MDEDYQSATWNNDAIKKENSQPKAQHKIYSPIENHLKNADQNFDCVTPSQNTRHRS